ncbi:MAG: EamA family transporter [Oscillatoria sp. PMC 1051.18]|nr:EamA family transporter [Oscillatoria sp. PMC 1050.18]MEC5028734.1 EamA family transporter [Oscillatoria sp. PMC 1051.18]
MGQLDNQPENYQNVDPGAAETRLREITDELENLKQNFIFQLSQEIEQLQIRKNRLQQEVEQLELNRQQQLNRQQELIQQIAPALVNQLEDLLRQGLTLSARDRGASPTSAGEVDYNENARQLILSLDSTLRTTFRTLQQDLSSYQSSLSQQLGQMYNLEQQGEAILEALVSRLKAELQTEAIASPPPTSPPPRRTSPRYQSPEVYQTEAIPEPPPPTPTVTSSSRTKIPKAQPPSAEHPAPTKRQPKKQSKLQLGITLALLSSLALSLYNVVVAIVLKPASVLGLFELGGYISPSVGNSLLILWLRMVVVVPMMAILAGFLYSRTWQDIMNSFQSKDWRLWLKVIGSGFFLFLSQVLIYISFGSALSPGVVITIFFIFPIVTVLLSWLLFGERPTLIRSIATAVVFLGVVLISLAGGGAVESFPLRGFSTAVGSGITFAFYVLLTQASAKKLHPVPFSVVNFVTILIFSGLSLFIFPFLPLPPTWDVSVDPLMWSNLIVSGLILGGLTLLSYLLNNIGIGLIGAARASIFGATGPVLTTILAWLIIGRPLIGIQWVGMLIVTLGVLGLSLERMWKKPKPAKNTNR